MDDFTTIETQEQLDAIIGERLKREKNVQEKKYSGYISPDDFKAKTGEFEKQIADLNSALDEANKKAANHAKEIEERDSKIKAYESHSVKSRIAHEAGLSYEAVKFLQGEDEESIKKSAESLKSLLTAQPAPPLANPEGNGGGSDPDAALRQTLRKLKGE